jgi:hypothetical protein
MIVDFSPSGGLRLVEPDDFKSFKLRLRGTSEARPEIPSVTFVDDANVQIAVDAVASLPGAPSTPEWKTGFDRMIDHAADKGWIDPATNAIRAHVERAG